MTTMKRYRVTLYHWRKAIHITIVEAENWIYAKHKARQQVNVSINGYDVLELFD